MNRLHHTLYFSFHLLCQLWRWVCRRRSQTRRANFIETPDWSAAGAGRISCSRGGCSGETRPKFNMMSQSPKLRLQTDLNTVFSPLESSDATEVLKDQKKLKWGSNSFAQTAEGPRGLISTCSKHKNIKGSNCCLYADTGNKDVSLCSSFNNKINISYFVRDDLNEPIVTHQQDAVWPSYQHNQLWLAG